jgi:hypothetical protein
MKTRRNWTQEELKFLKARYPDSLSKDIAEALKRPLCSVYGKAYMLGLSKSESFISSDKSQRLTGCSGIKTRFVKGQKPWNKGIKMPICDEAARYQYPKGHLPHNTKEDGCISERRDINGNVYKWIRVGLSKWVMLHVKNWVDANGPVPAGYVVVFKNAKIPDRENITNLELITRQELMSRNTLRQWPEDLQKTIKALNKLKKSINGKR